MFSFESLVALIFVYYKYPLLLGLILTKVISALYLRTNYDKWWLGLLPFGHYYYKRELAGVELYFIIPSILTLVSFITSYSAVSLVLWLIFSAICNYKFAVIYLDSYNAWLYSLVPFAQYGVMIKEVMKHE